MGGGLGGLQAAVGSGEYGAGSTLCQLPTNPPSSAHGDYGGPSLAAPGPPSMASIEAASPQVSYSSDLAATTSSSLTALGYTPPGGRSRPPTGEEVVCGVCGKVLCNKYVLKTHLRDMHGPRQSLQCPVCHRMYASLNSLRAHMSGTHKKLHQQQQQQQQQQPSLRY
ncbi:Broad-complex core protein-like 6 [Homarus americanus]|uniref:Broad-complex core protein-like 6 n=1 Tax=Homarus americanus TaxID=6706 RepID=A0A8J5K563_HOMAM|nr:Broad-complex core protein-like 6 [Homarus americanus]